MLGVALISFGQVMLLMRAGMDAERSEDYVLTGKAKGLTDRAVRDRHVARNVDRTGPGRLVPGLPHHPRRE